MELQSKVAEFHSLLRSVGDTSAQVQTELLATKVRNGRVLLITRVRNGKRLVPCDGDPSAVTRWFIAWISMSS